VPAVTIDTNIFISAFEYAGKPRALVQMALDGEINVAISQPIIDETLRVLRDKFGWFSDDLQGARNTFDACTHKVTPTQTLDVVTEDPSDNRILECAVEAGSEFIVTGDKDLLRRGPVWRGIRIMKVAEFLDIMTERRRAQ
jgi:putative PIN family toxin of toxin-antitoxin system